MEHKMIKQILITECKHKLLSMKEDLLNRIKNEKLEVTIQEKMSGDEIDQTVAQLIENQFAANQNRLRKQLLEIEFALSRIQKGEFGICEETQEPIEEERLLAIPDTRLSIEGAEIRESLQKKYARHF